MEISWLPVTVIFAIALFIAREITDAIRRRGANKRRIRAIKKILQRELEKLNRAVDSLNALLNDVASSMSESEDGGDEIDFNLTFTVTKTSAGKDRFRAADATGELFSASNVPMISNHDMGRVMLEVASLDTRLFEFLERAYDASATLLHVRESFIRYVNAEEEEDAEWLSSFVIYARAELVEIHNALTTLYAECTGGKVLKRSSFR